MSWFNAAQNVYDSIQHCYNFLTFIFTKKYLGYEKYPSRNNGCRFDAMVQQNHWRLHISVYDSYKRLRCAERDVSRSNICIMYLKIWEVPYSSLIPKTIILPGRCRHVLQPVHVNISKLIYTMKNSYHNITSSLFLSFSLLTLCATCGEQVFMVLKLRHLREIDQKYLGNFEM
jgi:hypothetical protein